MNIALIKKIEGEVMQLGMDEKLFLLKDIFNSLEIAESNTKAEMNNLSSTDLTSFFEELKKQKNMDFPLVSVILNEIREDII